MKKSAKKFTERGGGDKNSRNWILGILVGFVVVVMVDIFYIIAANRTWRGVVSQNAYQVGVNYNKVLEQKKWQESLKIKISSRYEDKQKLFILELRDEKNQPIADAKITANFKRILNQKLDFSAELLPILENNDQKKYGAEVKFPACGKWWADYQIALPQSFLSSRKNIEEGQNPSESSSIYLYSEEIYLKTCPTFF